MSHSMSGHKLFFLSLFLQGPPTFSRARSIGKLRTAIWRPNQAIPARLRKTGWCAATCRPMRQNQLSAPGLGAAPSRDTTMKADQKARSVPAPRLPPTSDPAPRSDSAAAWSWSFFGQWCWCMDLYDRWGRFGLQQFRGANGRWGGTRPRAPRRSGVKKATSNIPSNVMWN